MSDHFNDRLAAERSPVLPSQYTPPGALWSSEKEVQAWFEQYLAEFPEIHTLAQLRMVDVFGKNARCDLGLQLYKDGEPLLFSVELKHETHRSTNAADAYAQAFHYQEMCLVRDPRVKEAALLGKSPALSFAGIFVAESDTLTNRDAERHAQRRLGMEILANKLRVGSVRYYPWRGTVEFWFGEQAILRLTAGRGSSPKLMWGPQAHNYISSNVKRNGSRRGRETIAERAGLEQSL